jgi:hypothetical protein
MSHLLTKDQFGAGTTIDGNRIDRALADLVARFNSLRAGDREHRWVERTLHSHWHPNSASLGTPFKSCTALLSAYYAPLTPFLSTNRYKHKGYSAPGLDPTDHVAWTTTWSSSERSRLRRVSAMCMQIEPYETYNWQYGAVAPEGSSASDFINDVCLEVLVMNPSAIERRDKASLVLLRERFRASAQLIYPLTPLPAAPATMLPDMPPPGYPYGLSIDVELDVALPPYARCVAALILPKYPAGSPYNTPWTIGEPWTAGHWNKSITVQEPA